MKPIPLVPPQRSRRWQTVRPLVLLAALASVMYFTEPGRQTLIAVKNHFFSSSDSGTTEGGIATPDPLAAKASDAASSPGVTEDVRPVAPSASSAGGVDIAVPVPALPDVKALAAEAAASAASAAEEEASAASAAEEAQGQAAAVPTMSEQMRAVREAGAAPGLLAAVEAATQAKARVRSEPVGFEAPGGNPPSTVLVEASWAAPSKGGALEKVSAFAGVWEGTFNGATPGEMLVKVEADGRFKATLAIDGRKRMFSMTGSVTPDGSIGQDPRNFMGPLGLFEVYGQFKGTEAYGGWRPGSGLPGGSWAVRRVP